MHVDFVEKHQPLKINRIEQLQPIFLYLLQLLIDLISHVFHCIPLSLGASQVTQQLAHSLGAYFIVALVFQQIYHWMGMLEFQCSPHHISHLLDFMRNRLSHFFVVAFGVL